MHLDTAGIGIEARQVTEPIQLKIRVQLAIDASQDVEIEGGGDSERIVVGVNQLGWRFLQVRSKQQGVAGLKNRPDVTQKNRVCGMAEVPDSATEKQHQNPLAIAPAGRYFEQAIEIFALQADDSH